MVEQPNLLADFLWLRSWHIHRRSSLPQPTNSPFYARGATIGPRSGGVNISRSGDSPGFADLSPVLIDGDEFGHRVLLEEASEEVLAKQDHQSLGDVAVRDGGGTT